MKPTKTYLRFLCDIAKDMQTLSLSLRDLELQGSPDFNADVVQHWKSATLDSLETVMRNVNVMADLIHDHVSGDEGDTDTQRQETVDAINALRNSPLTSVTEEDETVDTSSIDDHRQEMIRRFHVKRVPQEDELDAEPEELDDMEMKLKNRPQNGTGTEPATS
jgi:hypothetical protein